MHADGDWQAVEGVLTKDMATEGEYLQTWKLKLRTAKTLSAAFHLNNKEAKCELKVKYNNEILPFCSEPKYLGVDGQGFVVEVDFQLTFGFLVVEMEDCRHRLRDPEL